MTTSPTQTEKTVFLEELILESPVETLVRRTRQINFNGLCFQRQYFARKELAIPQAATCRGVTPDLYHGYRRGLAAACTDAVLVQIIDGVPKVPLIKRKNPPFKDCWWMTGGVQFNFVPLPLFALWKIMREYGQTQGTLDDFMKEHSLALDAQRCGPVHIVGPLGVARTATDEVGTNETVCDTINICLMAVSDRPLKLSHDKDHTSIRWFAHNELSVEEIGHGYPFWAASRALSIYNEAEEGE